MATQHIIFLVCGLILLAIVLQPLSQRIHLPFSATLVIAGFAVSELLVGYGVDTGIRAGNFHSLVFYVFLPVLIFESAYRIDARLLLGNLVPILFLAIPLMLLSTMLTAVLVYYGIGHPQGFPWIAALLTGALLSATDPVAVVAIFRQLGVPERLVMLLEGESLFNDATAIVVFSVFLTMATQASGAFNFVEGSLYFLRVLFGGILAGAVVGTGFLLITRLIDHAITRAAASIICAYLSFAIAESFLHVSGVMAVLVAGLLLGHAARTSACDGDDFVGRLWEFNAWIANALVFLLMGVTITTDMFTERWLAILIGIAAVILARAAGVFGLLPLLPAGSTGGRIYYAERSILFWGGLRGAVTLALALSLPVSLDYWWTIQSIAFGVVLFTVLVQATTMTSLIGRLDMQ